MDNKGYKTFPDGLRMRTCKVCSLFSLASVEDTKGEHHPSCHLAPESERNMLSRMLEDTRSE